MRADSDVVEHRMTRIMISICSSKPVVASVLRVDSIHRSHLIAGHRSVQVQLGPTGTAGVLDTGIKPVTHQ
jgi:hypothetical protein